MHEVLADLRVECFESFGTINIKAKEIIRFKNIEAYILVQCVNGDKD